MYSSSSIPKRAQLHCRWQLTGSRDRDFRYAVAEISEGALAVVHKKDLSNEMTDENTTRTADVPRFDHELLADSPYSFTVMGRLACHVMWPFDPRHTADIIVGVDELHPRFRVFQVEASRLLVARSTIEYIDPTDDIFIETLARGDRELPHGDVFDNNSR